MALKATITVPSDATQINCRSCTKPIYMVRTANDRLMPVDCEVEGGVKPSRGASRAERERFALTPEEQKPRDGLGVSHFATCPNASLHRKGRH